VMRLRQKAIAIGVCILAGGIAYCQQVPAAPNDHDAVLTRYLKLLHSEHPKDRYYGAIQVARLGHVDSLPALEEIFRDGDIGTRYQAAKALDRVKDRDALFAVLQKISIQNQGRMVGPVLVATFHCFADKPETFALLRSLLRARETAIAVAAAETMGTLTAVDAIAEMPPLVLDDTLPIEVRTELIGSMKKSALNRLQGAYVGLDESVKNEQIREALAAQLEELDSAYTVSMVESVQRVNAPEGKPLTATERQAAWLVLSDANKPKNERLRLLRQIGLTKDSQSVDRLITLCEETDDTEMKGSMLVTLGQIGDERAIPLATRLKNSPDQFVADMATLALELLNNE